MNRITRSREGVARLLRDDMNRGIPEGEEFNVGSVLPELNIAFEALPAFPIEWEDANDEGAHDPFVTPPNLAALEGAAVFQDSKLKSGWEFTGHGYVVVGDEVTLLCSIPWRPGRTRIYWKGKAL